MSAGPSWRTVERMEQARWERFARAHAHESDLCAALVRQLDGELIDRLTQADAQALAAVASAHGWSLERAGSSGGRRRRR